MKKLAVALFSLTLLASCSVQTDSQVHADGTAASVAAPAGGGDGGCCSDNAGKSSCCSGADKGEAKADACGDACAPNAAAKQP